MNKQQEYLNQKRGGTSLTLNSFRRSQYAAALQSLGETVLSGETKIDLFKRIMANPSAAAAVVQMFSWQSRATT